MVVNAALPYFLKGAAERPFVWGEFDCGLWLANWYIIATEKPDPAAHLRGAYHDEASCLALCGPLGFPRMIQRIADTAGLKRTRDPLRGDIGIVRSRPGNVAVGAICVRDGWAFLSTGGGVSAIRSGEHVRLMAAWRIP